MSNLTEESRRDQVLRLHVLYLEKLEKLSSAERRAFKRFLNHLANPAIIVDGNPEHKEN